MRARRPATVALALAAALLAAGCTTVVHQRPSKGGPPPHAPAYGRRAKMPPRITITPAVVVIVGSQVSYAENHPDDLFYFQGRWYRPYEGGWFWSVTLSGEWTEISVGEVPRPVLEVPPDYRKRKGGPPPHAPAHGRRGKGKS
jgi:hypothetical protein